MWLGFEGWCLDTGVTHLVYHDLSLFKNYNENKDKNIFGGSPHKQGCWNRRSRVEVHLLQDHHTERSFA